MACEFEQFDRRASLDDERDADSVGWAVRRNQNFAPASSEERSVTLNATCATLRTRSGTAASASKRIHEAAE